VAAAIPIKLAGIAVAGPLLPGLSALGSERLEKL